VNIHRPPYNGVSYAGFNRALDQIAATSRNLAVVDWNGMVDSGQAQVGGDGVHATPAGYQARADAIAQALQGCATPQSSSGSHTIAPSKKRKPAPAKPKAQPKPKPAAKPKAITTYTPTTSTAAPAAGTVATSDDGGGTSPWPFIGAAIAAIALGAGGYLLARRRRAT
jgi:hypothetical protein